MTTTTKIFVILVCFFAFVFTPMAIQFAARTYNWKALAEDYQNNAKTALASERSAKAIAASEIQYYKSLRDDEQKRVLDAQQRIGEDERKIDTLTQERDQLARSRDMLETQLGVLTAEMKVKSKHNDELGDAKEKALARERDLQATSTWLTDQLNLKRAEADVLKQQLNQKLQEMVACREENDQLRKSTNIGRAGEPLTNSPSPSVEAASPAASSPIQGIVTEIKGNLAMIDVGSASGLKPDMVMVITRNGFKEYIADLKITGDVSPNEAVGEIIAVSGKQVRKNDTVLDERSFNTR